MPTITAATCFILLITWIAPGPIYAAEFPGTALVDGEAVTLNLEQAYPEAVWTASLHPGQWVVDSAYVIITQQPGTAVVSNAPFVISCSQVWFPFLEKEIDNG